MIAATSTLDPGDEPACQRVSGAPVVRLQCVRVQLVAANMHTSIAQPVENGCPIAISLRNTGNHKKSVPKKGARRITPCRKEGTPLRGVAGMKAAARGSRPGRAR